MRIPFYGNSLGDTYPTKQLYNRGGQLVPYSGNRPKSSAVLEILNSRPATIVATAMANKIKGGNPDVDINSETPKNQKARSRGGRNGGRSGNSRKGGGSKSDSDRSEASGVRGYQDQSGISCLLFSSGVSSGLTVNTRIVNSDYTPLYLSSGWLFITTDSNIDLRTEFSTQLQNIIYPLVESAISNKIQRYAGRYINSDDFDKYIHSLVKALQLYYTIDSILTYCSNTTLTNINVGMEYLRSQLSAETIVEFNLLRETLETCNSPVNLLNYIRFMCQNYRTSDAPHSPIIRLNVGGMFDAEWTTGPRVITDLLSNTRLDLISKNKMVSYLNQAFPNWTIKEMPASSNEACYNPEFFTFWHNQNCTYLSTNSANNGNFEYSIKIDNLDSYTDYQIIQDVNDVDGVIFVTQTYNIMKSDKKEYISYWGVWQPLASVANKNTKPGDPRYTFNIKCFTLNSKIESCTDSTMLGASGIYNLIEYSGSSANWTANRIKFGAYGFVKLQNVSVRMQTESFNNTMRFWFMGE